MVFSFGGEFHDKATVLARINDDERVDPTGVFPSFSYSDFLAVSLVLAS